MSSSKPLLYLAIAAGLAAGLFSAAQRFRVEQRNRSVEIAVDMAEAERLASASGQPVGEVLAQLKASGATSVAVTEETVGDLADRGLVWLRSVGLNSTQILDGTLPDHAPRLPRPDELSARGLAIDAEHGAVGAGVAQLRQTGVGLNVLQTAAAEGAGLRIIARIAAFPGAKRERMTRVLMLAGDRGAKTVIFTGTEVFGFRGHYEDAAAAFRDTRLLFGQVEMGKQKGEESLGAALKGQFVRVHSIPEGEMDQLDPAEAVDRFARAARERNIRLCYVRLPFFSGQNPLAESANFLNRVKRAIERRGSMATGPSRPFEPLEVPFWAQALIALGTAAGLSLLAGRLLGLNDGSSIALFLAAGVALAALAAFAGGLGQKAVALLAAFVFPALGCLLFPVFATLGDPPETPSISASPVRSALLGILACSLVTSIAIVYVVGLLASLGFMVKVDQFAGIKLAHALPFLVIAAAMVSGLPKPGGEKSAVRERARDLLAKPVLWGWLIAGGVALVLFATILARTGNEPGIGVSGIELKLRALLDAVLPARPRTKEFLFGHPALVLGWALWARNRSRWAAPLLAAGSLGQVSLVNTFCHIHSPLTISFVRLGTGLVFGAVIGVLAFWVVLALEARASRFRPA